MNTLPYTEAVLLENSRFNPTVQITFKSPTEDTTLGPWKVRKGQTLFTHFETIGNEGGFFTNPGIFDPERFLSDKYGKADPKNLFPFGFGRRLCPGQNLGNLTLRLTVIHFFSKFKICPAPRNDSGKLFSKYEIVRAVDERSTEVYVDLC